MRPRFVRGRTPPRPLTQRMCRPHRVSGAGELRCSEAAVWATLRSLAGPAGVTTAVSYAALADAAGCARITARVAIARLADRGLIVEVRHRRAPSGAWLASAYCLSTGSAAAPPYDIPSPPSPLVASLWDAPTACAHAREGCRHSRCWPRGPCRRDGPRSAGRSLRHRGLNLRTLGCSPRQLRVAARPSRRCGDPSRRSTIGELMILIEEALTPTEVAALRSDVAGRAVWWRDARNPYLVAWWFHGHTDAPRRLARRLMAQPLPQGCRSPARVLAARARRLYEAWKDQPIDRSLPADELSQTAQLQRERAAAVAPAKIDAAIAALPDRQRRELQVAATAATAAGPLFDRPRRLALRSAYLDRHGLPGGSDVSSSGASLRVTAQPIDELTLLLERKGDLDPIIAALPAGHEYHRDDSDLDPSCSVCMEAWFVDARIGQLQARPQIVDSVRARRD